MPSSCRRPRRRRSTAALFLALLGLSAYTLLVGVAVTLTPAPAQAHTSLVSSDPEADSTLEALPGAVTLTFTEEIGEPAYVVVRTADGTTYEDGAATVDGPVVTQQLVDADVSGKVTIAYRVVSADGHAVTGEFDVTVTGDGDSGPATGGGATAADHGDEHPDGTVNDSDDSGPSASLLVGVGVGALLVLAGAAWLVGLNRRNRP